MTYEFTKATFIKHMAGHDPLQVMNMRKGSLMFWAPPCSTWVFLILVQTEVYVRGIYYICFTCPCFTCPGTHAYPHILTSCHSRGAMARLVEVGSILLVATIALSSLRISLSCVCCICNFGGNLMGGYWMETWKTFQTHRTE